MFTVITTLIIRDYTIHSVLIASTVIDDFHSTQGYIGHTITQVNEVQQIIITHRNLFVLLLLRNEYNYT